MTLKEAKAIRAAVEAAAVSLDDKTASTAPMVFPRLKQDGSLVKYGTRICWNNVVKRAAVDLWDTAENTPDVAPTLWEDILYKDGIRIIPAVPTAGTAFTQGEDGWWEDGKLYTSLINNNVWTPASYPAGWQIKT